MLFAKIEKARLEARKAKNKTAADLLGLIIGQIQQTRKTDDESVRAVLSSVMKGINDRIEKAYTELDVADAHQEKAIVAEFLPSAITDEQINAIVNGKTLLDLHRVLGPNINAIAGKMMGQLSAGAKRGEWTIPDPKELKFKIETYVRSTLAVIGD